MSALDVTLRQVLEALAFAADEPVTPDQIAGVYAKVTGNRRPALADIEAAAGAANKVYTDAGIIFRLQHWAGGYCLSTTATVRDCLTEYLHTVRGRRLSRPLMETLAILAYRQPATKPEIDHIRGVDSDYTLRRLQEVGLADVVGRAETVGRPLLYGTTNAFLEEFGLGSLDQLPDLREIDELLADSPSAQEKARLILLEGSGPQAELDLE